MAFGFALGLIVAVPFLVFWGEYIPKPDISDGVIGAIIGGLIGAAAAFGGQLLVIRDNLDREERGRWQDDRARCIGLFGKLLDLQDSIVKTRSIIMEHDAHMIYVQSANSRECLHNPPALPLKVVEISAHEFSFLIEQRVPKLFNEAGELSRGYASLVGLSDIYAEKIRGIRKAALSSEQATVKGRRLEGRLTEESEIDLVEARDCRLLMINLVRELVPISQLCLTQVTELLAEKYKMKVEMEFRENTSAVRASELES